MLMCIPCRNLNWWDLAAVKYVPCKVAEKLAVCPAIPFLKSDPEDTSSGQKVLVHKAVCGSTAYNCKIRLTV